MKELTIEQKAKAYDEALERAKAMIKVAANQDEAIGFTNTIFPELKENEDEGIRKALINGFNKLDKSAVWYNGITNGQILAWLEKQGVHANFRNKIQIGDKVTRNEDGVLVNLSQLNRVAKVEEKQGKNNMGISEATKQKLEDSLNNALEKETSESCNEFLEKQGEYKCTYQLNNLKSNIKFPFKAKVKSSGAIVTIHDGQLSPDGKEWIKYQSDAEDRYKVYEPNNLELVCEIEQKSAAWSEEDEEMLKMVIKLCEQCGNEYAYYWLKSLKDRIQPQQERERILEKLEEWLDEYISNLADVGTDTLIGSFRKYLDGKLPVKPRNRWKPTEEQMVAIDTAINVLGKGTLNGRQLIELQEQLKAL